VAGGTRTPAPLRRIKKPRTESQTHPCAPLRLPVLGCVMPPELVQSFFAAVWLPGFPRLLFIRSDPSSIAGSHPLGQQAAYTSVRWVTVGRCQLRPSCPRVP
jgi:hypothetical protein